MFVKKGYTLIEIVVVLVIIGILAAIAVPSYLTYMQQGAAKAAQGNLIAIYNAEKSYYFTNNDTYCTTAVCPGTSCCDTEADINANLSLNLADTYFTYTCSPVGGFTCTATAVSIPGFSMTLYSTPIVTIGGANCAAYGGARPPSACNPDCNPGNSIDCPS